MIVQFISIHVMHSSTHNVSIQGMKFILLLLLSPCRAVYQKIISIYDIKSVTQFMSMHVCHSVYHTKYFDSWHAIKL